MLRRSSNANQKKKTNQNTWKDQVQIILSRTTLIQTTSDKKEREKLEAFIEGLKGHSCLPLKDLLGFFNVIKPELLHVEGIFDVFYSLKVELKAFDDVFKELKTAIIQNNERTLPALRVLQCLFSSQNSNADHHFRHMMERSRDTIECVVKKLKIRYPSYTQLFSISIINEFIRYDKGMQELYKHQAIDKLILLLYNDPSEDLEFMVGITSFFLLFRLFKL